MLKLKPISIVLIYAVMGSLWILFSDEITHSLFASKPDMFLMVSTLKGWFFIVITSVFLLSLIRKYDIQRQTQEDTIKKNEERLALVLKASNDGWWDWDLNSNQFYYSPRWWGMLGYPPKERVDSPEIYKSFIHPDDAPYVMNRVRDLAAGNLHTLEMEFRLKHKDGHYIPVLSRAFAQRDAAKKMIRLSGTNTDLTRQKAVEHALKESEERFRSLVEAAPDAVFVQVDGIFTYINSSGQRLLGAKKPEDLLGRTVLDFFHPHYREIARERIRRLNQGQQIPTFEFRFQTLDGREGYMENCTSGFSWAGEQGSLTFARDVTERRKAREELLKAKERAEQANKAKSEFLANMSHEIRTPLNGMLGMLQLLQMTDPTQEQTDYINTAIRSSQRLHQLLTDLLDLSMIEAGKMLLHSTNFSLIEMRQSILEVFATAASGKKITLEFDLDERIPDHLSGDAARLRQILFNLVGNALKFTETGSISVEFIRTSRKDELPIRILGVVSDTGSGIPAGKLTEIFEPFTQVDPSFVRRHQGAGLGLAIVKRIVALMGGELYIESEVGLGTTIYVILPFESAQIKNDLNTMPNVKTHPQRALNILLVEDDEVNSVSMERLLTRSGYKVAIATNGEEALTMAAQQKFDLILMDIQMPVMDGLEATRRIRAGIQGINPQIPIIVLTAYAMTGDKEACLTAGANDYLSKPVEIEQLFLSIAEHTA